MKKNHNVCREIGQFTVKVRPLTTTLLENWKKVPSLFFVLFLLSATVLGKNLGERKVTRSHFSVF